MKKILVINAGSSSFKFKVFSFPKEEVIAKEWPIVLDWMTLHLK